MNNIAIAWIAGGNAHNRRDFHARDANEQAVTVDRIQTQSLWRAGALVAAGNGTSRCKDVALNLGENRVEVRWRGWSSSTIRIVSVACGPAAPATTGVAALVLLIGAALVYFMTAVRPGPVEFLISIDGEMKKVNWSTRRDIYRSTLVVIFASLFIASGLFVVDSAFAAFFKFVGVLQQ